MSFTTFWAEEHTDHELLAFVTSYSTYCYSGLANRHCSDPAIGGVTTLHTAAGTDVMMISARGRSSGLALNC